MINFCENVNNFYRNSVQENMKKIKEEYLAELKNKPLKKTLPKALQATSSIIEEVKDRFQQPKSQSFSSAIVSSGQDKDKSLDTIPEEKNEDEARRALIENSDNRNEDDEEKPQRISLKEDIVESSVSLMELKKDLEKIRIKRDRQIIEAAKRALEQYNLIEEIRYYAGKALGKYMSYSEQEQYKLLTEMMKICIFDKPYIRKSCFQNVAKFFTSEMQERVIVKDLFIQYLA